MTDFNLSEKIKKLFEIDYLDSMADVQGDITIILKEFIKKLKENIDTEYDDVNECIREEIDKLAGDKLIS